MLLRELWGRNFNRLSRHYSALEEGGYDDLSVLIDATVSDLEEIDIPAAHGSKIIQLVKASMEASENEDGSNRKNMRLIKLLKTADDKARIDERARGEHGSSSDTESESESVSTEQTMSTAISYPTIESRASKESNDVDSSSDDGVGGAGGGDWLRPGHYNGPSESARKSKAQVANKLKGSYAARIAATHRAKGNQAW